MNRTVYGIFTLFMLFAVTGVSRADLEFGGGARSDAMGGAGIAIVDNSGTSNFINPASLALMNRHTTLAFPGIGFHASGIPLDKAINHLFGNPDQSDAVGLARDFGKNPSDFGISLNLGIRFAHMDLQGSGIARVHIIPNAALESWAQNANGDVSQLLTNPLYKTGRADLLGAATYALPSIGMAERISPPGSPTRIEAGVRMKVMHAYYTHYIINAATIAANGSAATAPEMNGQSNLQKTGFGMDAGLLVHPGNMTGFSGALVITDLIEPNFVFHGTDANGNPAKYDIQPRSFSMGSAYRNNKFLMAADLVDFTRAYGNVQGRVGAEYRTKRLAFRTGYASPSGFIVGVGIYGFDIAFGGRSPFTISDQLHF
jgi:hypothetical protein